MTEGTVVNGLWIGSALWGLYLEHGLAPGQPTPAVMYRALRYRWVRGWRPWSVLTPARV